MIDLRIFRVIAPTEDQWLNDCFVPVAGYLSLLNERSTLASVEDGSGKSALIVMCQQALQATWLNVNLRPAVEAEQNAFLEPLFQDITEQMWAYIEAHPACLEQIGSRITPLRYFLNRYFGKLDLVNFYLERLKEDHPEVAAVADRLITMQPPELFTDSASTTQKLEVLCDCVQKLGLRGVMIWMEVSDTDRQTDRLIDYAQYFFDSVALLRRRNVHFKCLAPPRIWNKLMKLRGVETLSAEPLFIDWQEQGLLQMVDARLRIASQGQVRHLDALVNLEAFTAFAQAEMPAQTPRNWLHLAHIVAEGVGADAAMPIDVTAWETAKRKYYTQHVRIWLDEDEVFRRGSTEVLAARQSSLFKLVKHLYDHPGFHKIHKLQQALDMDATNINTYIHRVRKAIEPMTDAEPIYLVTDPKREAYALQFTDHAT